MMIGLPHPLHGSRQRLRFLVAGFGILFLSGCAVPGAPLPPSTGIPKFVGDLKAVRKGDTVSLTWTTPKETSDGVLIKKPGRMQVQRALSSGRDAELSFHTISEQTLEPTLKDDRAAEANAKDSLTELLQSGANEDFAFYSILAQSRSGKSVGLPNRVSIPLILALPTPQKVEAVAVPTGIQISWDQALPPKKESPFNIQYAYRIMRKEEAVNDSA